VTCELCVGGRGPALHHPCAARHPAEELKTCPEMAPRP
jgi:hypothetical protein